MTPDVTTLQVVPPCPTCAHRDTLVMLGDRLDHPHPWLVWRTRRTFIYLCLHCEAVVALAACRRERRCGLRDRVPLCG